MVGQSVFSRSSCWRRSSCLSLFIVCLVLLQLCRSRFGILSLRMPSVSLTHSVLVSTAFSRVRRESAVGYLSMILFAIFIFLPAIIFSIFCQPASICRISFATPIGAHMKLLSVLLLTMFALFMTFCSFRPEVISSPYRYTASMQTCAALSLCIAFISGIWLKILERLYMAIFAFSSLALGWAVWSFLCIWYPRYLMFVCDCTSAPASLMWSFLFDPFTRYSVFCGFIWSL